MPTILLAQEDEESRQRFSELILGFFPTASLHPLATWAAMETALAQAPGSAVLLAEVFWEGEGRTVDLLLAAESAPQVPVAILSRYDCQTVLFPGYPLPVLAPDNQLPLKLAECWEDESGRDFGPYRISAPAGPHPLGRLYWAKHRELQRPVQMLVPPAGSAGFSRAIHAWARLNHPAVYALYESVPWENRILVALEPVSCPSLLHLRHAGQTPNLLACARIAATLASVLAEMESSSIPARLLGEYDYTLSPKGIPRLRNPAAYHGLPACSLGDNASALADILEPLLSGQGGSARLIQILRHPGSSAFDLLRQTRAFELQLAEVREVHVRKEELEAAAKIFRARRVRRGAIWAGALLFAVFVAVYARVLFHRFFLDAPGNLAAAELPVPAGSVLREGETVQVGAFFLDRHEVTIGQYEKFLDAARQNPGWRAWVPPEARSLKESVESLEPRDWREILRRARKQETYQQQSLTRDTPVFNVDYYSAATYANWQGRRLPRLEEWLRAAGGDGRPYPWGQDRGGGRANLGLAREDQTGRDRGDSYFNAAPGETFPDDRGPFGHFDLGGNVSEWGVGPFQKPVALGGNFTDPSPIPLAQARRQDGNRNDPPPSAQLEVIGFRTAR